jgi:hypothetical protein
LELDEEEFAEEVFDEEEPEEDEVESLLGDELLDSVEGLLSVLELSADDSDLALPSVRESVR